MNYEKLPTLYHWAGGKEALENLTQLFYKKVSPDNWLCPVLKNLSAEHAGHVGHFISELFGSAGLYTQGDDGSYAEKTQHYIIPVGPYKL